MEGILSIVGGGCVDNEELGEAVFRFRKRGEGGDLEHRET